MMPKNSPLAWDKDSDDAILHEKRVCQILSTMGMQLPSSLAPVAPIKQRTRTRNAKTPLPTESHDAPWPDKQTVEDLYAARCRDVQGGDVEGKREQFARFESLVLARFQSHAINISCAGVGAAFADEVATLLRKGNAADVRRKFDQRRLQHDYEKIIQIAFSHAPKTNNIKKESKVRGK